MQEAFVSTDWDGNVTIRFATDGIVTETVTLLSEQENDMQRTVATLTRGVRVNG